MARRNSPAAEPARPEVLAFLDDIKRNPDDDAPRLIFADWLEERGDPRGEFLRVQCALPSLSDGDPRRKALQQRERQLLKLHRRNWGRPWRTWANLWGYRRGLGQLSVSSLDRLLHAPWDRLVRTDALGWVDSLDVYFTGADDNAICRRFVANPLLRHLVSLSLYLLPRGTVLLESLADCTRTPYLSAVRLVLVGPQSSSLRTLTHSPLARQLRELILRFGRCGPDEIAILADSPCLSQLCRLDVSCNGIGPAGVRSLAASSSLAQLRELRLGSSVLGVEGIRALAAGGLPSLRTLDLSDNNLRVAGAEALAAVPPPTLQSLDLSSNGLTYRAAAALAASPLLDPLTYLNLLNNPLKDNGVRVLAGSPRLAQLTHLGLLNTQITDEGAKALVASPYLNNLAFLNLNYNHIGRTGKRALRNRFGPHAVSLAGQRT